MGVSVGVGDGVGVASGEGIGDEVRDAAGSACSSSTHPKHPTSKQSISTIPYFFNEFII